MSLTTRAEAVAAAVAAAPAPAGVSVVPAVLAAIGVVSLVVAVAIGVTVYVRLCKPELAAKLRPRWRKSGKASKGIVIGEPQLNFAPQHVENAISLRNASAEERVAISRRHLGKHHGVSTDLAARAAAMWDMPSSGSNDTASSGPAPATSSESDIAERETSQAKHLRRPRAAHLANAPRVTLRTAASDDSHSSAPVPRTIKRANRVAVPSQLLRSLGELPSVPDLADTTTQSSASESSIDSIPRLAPVVESKPALEDIGSLTPILNLNFDLEEPATSASKMPIEDELDFEIERSVWLTNTLSTAFDRIRSSPPSSALPTVAPLSRKTSTKGTRPSLESKRSSNSYGTGRNRSGSVSTKFTGGAESVYQSASSLASGRFSTDSYAPPLPSIPSHMHVAINMPEKLENNRRDSQLRKSLGKPIDVPVKEVQEDDVALPSLGFRPLSLGISLSSSSNSSIGAALFRNARRNFWGSSHTVAEDPESGLSSESSSGREEPASSASRYSSDDSLSRSSRASSRVFAPGVDAPPVPLLPVHLAPASEHADSSIPSVVISEISMDSSYDTQPTSIESLPKESPKVPPKDWPSIDKALPVISEPVASSPGKFAFVSPFHHAVFPEIPEEEEPPTEDDAEPKCELMSQLSSKPKEISRRPSFADNIRARLSKYSPAQAASPAFEPWSPAARERDRLYTTERPDTMSTISTAFGGPTEQWRVSTEDEEPPLFVAKSRDPAAHDAIGLGLSTQVVSGVLKARAAKEQAAGAKEQAAESPIMQSGKWASTRQVAAPQADIDFGALKTSIKLSSSATAPLSSSSPLEGVQRTLSRPSSRQSVRAAEASAKPAVLSPDVERPAAFSPVRSSRQSAFSFTSPRTDADTMSIASSCNTETMGEGLVEQAIDRRAKLLQSVQQSLAARTKREDSYGRFMLRDASAPPSTSSFARSKQEQQPTGAKKPSDLVLKPSSILPPHIVSPLTPPETPADVLLPSPTESAHTVRALPLPDGGASGRRSPLAAAPLSTASSGDSLSSSSSASTEGYRRTPLKAPKLRPLSLTANGSVLDDPVLIPSPTSAVSAAGAAASPAESAASNTGKARTPRQLYDERRQSRVLAGVGGVLPVHAATPEPATSFVALRTAALNQSAAAAKAAQQQPQHAPSAAPLAAPPPLIALGQALGSPQIGQAA